MKQSNHPTKKSAKQLFYLGVAFIPIAYFSDCVLDAILFSDETLLEHLVSPSIHEICIRLLFSTFIMGIALWGCHLLDKSFQRELRAEEQIQKLEAVSLELNQINLAYSRDLRGMVINVSALVGTLEEQCYDSNNEMIRHMVEELRSKTIQMDDFFDDLHSLVEQTKRMEG